MAALDALTPGDENTLPLPGDDLLGADAEQVTHGITIAATPEAIWPWLVQMGCRRAGFYSWDLLDNDGHRSAREIHPELQHLQVGDVIPATPDSEDGFEVLHVEPPRALILGGLYDLERSKRLPFDEGRPPRYWHVTWSFVLSRLDEGHTRLLVRARAACPATESLHRTSMRLMHDFMEAEQLRNLAARAEGRLPKDDFRDILEGVSGAAIMTLAALTPFSRERRSHWGLSLDEARATFPGDDLVPSPDWSWTHAVEIRASSDMVWPWLAQIGASKGGFYSYQWLENLTGCGVRNAEVVHPEWQVKVGDELVLHPRVPAPKVVAVEPGHYFVAHTPKDHGTRDATGPWAAMSWLFLVQPLGVEKCRVISRYRAACSADLATRLAFGPAILEPVAFAMDRRMLLGIKRRAESG